jgi:glyoxylase-like metal-dependent hydrolase (beta-lactamase superfamily II)
MPSTRANPARQREPNDGEDAIELQGESTMRRWLWILGRLLLVGLVLVGVGVGALAVTMTPAALPLSPLPPLAEPPSQPPAGMKIFAIRSGAMQSRAAFAYRGGSFGEERSFAMGGILVEHPRGNLLFETGFGRNVDDHVRQSPLVMRSLTEYSKGTPVADQLTAAGIDPHRLTGIVLTHAHWDHVSGIDDMRDVPVLVTQEERDFIASGGRATGLIRGFGSLPYKVYGFPNGPYLGFERSYDMFDDGSVVLVPAGGHTPGSIIAFITLPGSHRYALVGDIVWQREGVEIPAERPWLSRRIADDDEAQVRTVVVRLHMLKERFPELVVVPAHDERSWAALPTLAH